MTFPNLGMWYPRRQHFKFGSPILNGSLILQGPPAAGQGIGFIVRAPRAGFVRGFGYLSFLHQGTGATWNFGLWTVANGLPDVQVGTGNVLDAQLADNVWHELAFPVVQFVERDTPLACTIIAANPQPTSVYGMKYILGPINHWLAPYTITKADGLSSWTLNVAGIGETLPCLALLYLDGDYEVPFGCQPAIEVGGDTEVVVPAGAEYGFQFRPPFAMTIDGVSLLASNDGDTLQVRLYDATRTLLRQGPIVARAQMFDADPEYFTGYFEPIALEANALYYGVVHATGTNNSIHAYPVAGTDVIESFGDGGFTLVTRALPVGLFSSTETTRVWGAVHIGDVGRGQPGGQALALFFNPCPQECPDDPAPATGQVVAPAGVSGALGLPGGCGSPFIVTPCDPTYPA